MTAITTKSRQMRLDNCALNTPKRVQIAGNLRENACKDREAATPADAANAGLENNGKIRQIHPNTKLLGKYRLKINDRVAENLVRVENVVESVHYRRKTTLLGKYRKEQQIRPL